VLCLDFAFPRKPWLDIHLLLLRAPDAYIGLVFAEPAERHREVRFLVWRENFKVENKGQPPDGVPQGILGSRERSKTGNIESLHAGRLSCGLLYGPLVSVGSAPIPSCVGNSTLTLF
jgi:hypothetical protein